MSFTNIQARNAKLKTNSPWVAITIKRSWEDEMSSVVVCLILKPVKFLLKLFCQHRKYFNAIPKVIDLGRFPLGHGLVMPVN